MEAAFSGRVFKLSVLFRAIGRPFIRETTGASVLNAR